MIDACNFFLKGNSFLSPPSTVCFFWLIYLCIKISHLLAGAILWQNHFPSRSVLFHFGSRVYKVWNQKQHWFFQGKMIPIYQNKSQTDSNCSFSHKGLALFEGVGNSDRTFSPTGLVTGNCLFPWVKPTFKSHFKTNLKVSLKIKVLCHLSIVLPPPSPQDSSFLTRHLLLQCLILTLLYSHSR